MSKKHDDEVRAFPGCFQYFPLDTNYDENQGMTLRDWFAGKVIQGIMASAYAHPDCNASALARAQCAYEYANAMIAVRDSETGHTRKELAESVLACLKYPRGSEAQIRCLEEVADDAKAILKGGAS